MVDTITEHEAVVYDAVMPSSTKKRPVRPDARSQHEGDIDTSTLKAVLREGDKGKIRSEILRLAGSIQNRMRREVKGANRVIYKCGCDQLFSARELREHHCELKPPRGQEEGYEANEAEAKRYYAAKERDPQADVFA